MCLLVVSSVGLDVCKCMVLITNISNGIKELTCEYENCNTSQVMIFGVYVKGMESLYSHVTIFGSVPFYTIFLPRYEDI